MDETFIVPEIQTSTRYRQFGQKLIATGIIDMNVEDAHRQFALRVPANDKFVPRGVLIPFGWAVIRRVPSILRAGRWVSVKAVGIILSRHAQITSL